MVAARCPRCESVVALHEGRPFVTSHGTVELWHSSCWDVRDTPKAVVLETIYVAPVLARPAPVRRRFSAKIALGGALAGSAILALAIAHHAAASGSSVTAAGVSVSIDVTGVGDESTMLRATSAEHEIVPPRPKHRDVSEDFPIPFTEHGKTFVEAYPSLATWVHPITDAPELMPESPARHFGALRHGVVDRPECGEGHCGVDLHGPLGRPLVAVAAGQVVGVERRERGADGYSGRYVRIQHDDGTLTSYMHMDEIDPDLQVGDHLEQGQYIGTLGMTAVTVAHLHFALEVPHGDRTMFVDPAPFLARARVQELPERRHPVKPAF